MPAASRPGGRNSCGSSSSSAASASRPGRPASRTEIPSSFRSGHLPARLLWAGSPERASMARSPSRQRPAPCTRRPRRTTRWTCRSRCRRRQRSPDSRRPRAGPRCRGCRRSEPPRGSAASAASCPATAARAWRNASQSSAAPTEWRARCDSNARPLAPEANALSN